jgi:hypothetical protein
MRDLGRHLQAETELTHLVHFHMVHPGTRPDLRRAILAAKDSEVQWEKTAMFW